MKNGKAREESGHRVPSRFTAIQTVGLRKITQHQLQYQTV